jgi:NitT/TauT family transport system substrate-binding protein
MNGRFHYLKSRLVLAILTGFIGPVLLAPALTEAQMQKVRIGTVVSFESTAPVWTAVHKGYFREEGIEPEIVYLGGPRTRDALAAGEIDIGMIAVVVGAIARQAGLPFKLIGLWFDAEPFVVMVRADLADKVRSVSDLKGMRVVTPQTGSAAWAVGVAVFKKAGLNHETDLKLLHITDFAPQVWMNLLERKEVDAAVVWEPTYTVLTERGIAKPIVDLRKPEVSRRWLGGDVAFAGMFTTEKKLAERKDTFARVIRAAKKGYDFVRSAPAEEVAKLLAPEMKLDAATALKVVNLSRPAYGGDFRISQSRLSNDLRVYREVGILKREFSFQELVDPQFAGTAP